MKNDELPSTGFLVKNLTLVPLNENYFKYVPVIAVDICNKTF